MPADVPTLKRLVEIRHTLDETPERDRNAGDWTIAELVAMIDAHREFLVRALAAAEIAIFEPENTAAVLRQLYAEIAAVEAGDFSCLATEDGDAR